MNELKRNSIITLRVNNEEKAFIIKKAKLAESSSIGAYIRKMAIAGVIVKYENQDIKN